jgi:DNA-binding CsgD family transcriptional regulator
MWIVGVASVPGNLPFRIKNGEFIVGRTKSAQIVITERSVSRKHARLSFDGNVLVIEDLDSSNGSFVNDVEVDRGELKLGDYVRFGSVPCAVSATQIYLGAVSETDSTYQIPLPKQGDDTALMDAFTAAQLRIIPLLMKGKSEPEIAEILGKSFHTIHNQIRAIFDKAGVHSREELIVKVMDHR